MKPSRQTQKPSIPWLLALACLPLALGSCSSSSSGSIRGVPSQLPHIPIHASAATPSHNMPRGDYPFDSGGNYITAWAAEGAGRSGLNPGTDYSSWRSSHHGESSRSGRSSASRGKSSKSKTVAKSSKSKSKSSSARHTVKKGDTLSSIARRYGTSVSKIKAANGLKSDMIRDGRTLVVPR